MFQWGGLWNYLIDFFSSDRCQVLLTYFTMVTNLYFKWASRYRLHLCYHSFALHHSFHLETEQWWLNPSDPIQRSRSRSLDSLIFELLLLTSICSNHTSSYPNINAFNWNYNFECSHLETLNSVSSLMLDSLEFLISSHWLNRKNS